MAKKPKYTFDDTPTNMNLFFASVGMPLDKRDNTDDDTDVDDTASAFDDKMPSGSINIDDNNEETLP